MYVRGYYIGFSVVFLIKEEVKEMNWAEEYMLDAEGKELPIDETDYTICRESYLRFIDNLELDQEVNSKLISIFEAGFVTGVIWAKYRDKKI